MSMITEQINRLREAAMVMNGDNNIAKLFREAADTIEKLSSRVHEELAIQYAQGYKDGFLEGMKMGEGKE